MINNKQANKQTSKGATPNPKHPWKSGQAHTSKEHQTFIQPSTVKGFRKKNISKLGQIQYLMNYKSVLISELEMLIEKAAARHVNNWKHKHDTITERLHVNKPHQQRGNTASSQQKQQNQLNLLSKSFINTSTTVSDKYEHFIYYTYMCYYMYLNTIIK